MLTFTFVAFVCRSLTSILGWGIKVKKLQSYKDESNTNTLKTSRFNSKIIISIFQ